MDDLPNSPDFPGILVYRVEYIAVPFGFLVEVVKNLFVLCHAWDNVYHG